MKSKLERRRGDSMIRGRHSRTQINWTKTAPDLCYSMQDETGK
jgi:hypothetical protein